MPRDKAVFPFSRNLSQLLPPIRALVLDMDGVLWAGDDALVDLPRAFRIIRDLGLRVVLTTNNAGTPIPRLVEKLGSFGVEVNPGQIINAAMAVADLLERRFPRGGPVFVLGEQGLREALAERGYHHSERGALAVVVGLSRKVTFLDFCTATNLVLAGAFFIGTSPDGSFPQSDGTAVPGGGAFVAFVEASTRVRATIAGKPSPYLFELALRRLASRPEETLAIGDQLDTDIAGGQKAGCRTGLVLAIASTARELPELSPKPDLVAANLLDMLEG